MSDVRASRQRARIWAATAVALALAFGTVACSDASGKIPSATATATATATASPTTSMVGETTVVGADDGRVTAAPDSLTAAGVQVLEEGGDLTEVTSPVLLSRVQSDRMLADVGPQSGVLGLDLDALAPLPADVPPMSYFLASWVTTADTVGAATARTWMGEQNWTDAPHVRFPDAVVMLFVQDAATATQAEAVPAGSDVVAIDLSGFLPLGPEPVGEAVSGLRSAAAPAGGACTTVINFVGIAIGSIVNALHLAPVAGGGVFGDIGNFFVGLFNGAVALTAGIIQGLIDKITEPVLGLLKIGIGALAVSTIFVSLFRDIRVRVELEPGQGAQDYHFAVGNGADVKGQFVARSDSLTGQWPGILADCAQAVGMKLPTATGKGDPAKWAIEQGGDLISTGSLDGQVGDDNSARLDFTLGRESEEVHAKGEERNGNVFVRVRIPRKAVEDMLQLGRDTVVGAKQSLLSQVPLAPVRSIVDTALSAVIDPLLTQLQNEIVAATSGTFTLSGIGMVNVAFHETTTSSTTSTSVPDTEPADPGDGDFCTLFGALLDFLPTADSSDVVPWALEIVRQLQGMRAVAPAELIGDVDIALGVYQAVADSANVQVLIERTLPLGDAVARMGAFCGFAPRG